MVMVQPARLTLQRSTLGNSKVLMGHSPRCLQNGRSMAYPAAPRPNVSTLSKSEGPLYSLGSKLRRSPPSLQPTHHTDR